MTFLDIIVFTLLPLSVLTFLCLPKKTLFLFPSSDHLYLATTLSIAHSPLACHSVFLVAAVTPGCVLI